jgi:hypothetical protein
MLIIFEYYFKSIVLVDLLKNQIIIANDSVVYQRF